MNLSASVTALLDKVKNFTLREDPEKLYFKIVNQRESQ